jgi:hypothetical protein
MAWMAQQSAAAGYYLQQAGWAYVRAADALEKWLSVYPTDVYYTPADMAAAQQRLAASGFDATEVSDLKAVGLTDERIEALRQSMLTSDPGTMAFSTRALLSERIVIFRELAGVLIQWQPSQVPGATMAVSSDTFNLAMVGEAVDTIEVGNPRSSAAVIDLRVRRLGMPADWVVSVTPDQLTLNPGEHRTVTVRISPTMPVAQNTVGRAAVEAYVGTELLGGVQLEVPITYYVTPSDRLNVYLPQLRR